MKLLKKLAFHILKKDLEMERNQFECKIDNLTIQLESIQKAFLKPKVDVIYKKDGFTCGPNIKVVATFNLPYGIRENLISETVLNEEFFELPDAKRYTINKVVTELFDLLKEKAEINEFRLN